MQNKKRTRSYLSMIVVLSLVLNLFVSSVAFAADYDTPTEISTIFPDPNFANAMADWLGLTVGDQITRADINTRISAGSLGLDTFLSNKNISNLTGIDIFETTSITYFNLAGNNIHDLAPLSTLTQVTNLVVAGDFSDVTALGTLTNLTNLTVKSNNLSDVSGLATLVNLEMLGINGYDTSNSINSSTGCPVSDLSGLSTLVNLQYLTITSSADQWEVSPVDDTFLNPLSGLTNLTYLSIHGKESNMSNISTELQFTNLDALSGLSNLGGLHLESTAVNNIDGLSTIPGLTNVAIRESKLSDISSLSGFASKGSLMNLDLYRNSIYDISSIDNTFTALDELSIGDNMVSDISSLSGMGLTNLYIHGNFIDVYSDGINKTVATSMGAEGNYQYYLTADALTTPVDVNDTQTFAIFKQTTNDGSTPFAGYNFRLPVDSSLVTFSSDDNAVSTVNGSGLITAVDGGTANITASLNNMVTTSAMTTTSSAITVNAPVVTHASNVLIEYRDYTDQNYWTSFLMKNTTYEDLSPVRSSVHGLRSIQYDGVTGDITSTNSSDVGEWIISYDWPHMIADFNTTISGLPVSDKTVLNDVYEIPTGELVKFNINQAELQPADIYSNETTGNKVYTAPVIPGYTVMNPSDGEVTLNEDENRTIVFRYEVEPYIQGYVRDSEGTPIENATVNINGTEYTTDATGFYKAILPMNNAWNLENNIFANKDGYAMTAIDTFSLLPLSVGDPWQDKDFVLVPETGTITVKYLENIEPNNPVAPDDVLVLPLGLQTINAIAVDGYTLSGANSIQEMLFFHGQTSEVTFYYTPNPTPDPTPDPRPEPKPEPVKNIGVIKGNVRASGSGDPIVGAKVLTIGSNLEPKTTTTDENGYYEFEELPFGSYVMAVKTENAFFIKMIVVK